MIVYCVLENLNSEITFMNKYGPSLNRQLNSLNSVANFKGKLTIRPKNVFFKVLVSRLGGLL